jgi:hypothetical protein
MQPGDRMSLSFEWEGAVAGSYGVAVAAHRGPDHTHGCFEWIDPAATIDVPESLAADVPSHDADGPLRFSRLRVLP